MVQIRSQPPGHSGLQACCGCRGRACCLTTPRCSSFSPLGRARCAILHLKARWEFLCRLRCPTSLVDPAPCQLSIPAPTRHPCVRRVSLETVHPHGLQLSSLLLQDNRKQVQRALRLSPPNSPILQHQPNHLHLVLHCRLNHRPKRFPLLHLRPRVILLPLHQQDHQLLQPSDCGCLMAPRIWDGSVDEVTSRAVGICFICSARNQADRSWGRL